MSSVFRRALGETTDQSQALVTYLALVRNLLGIGRAAASFDELCGKVARAMLSALGYDQVVIVLTEPDGGELRVVAHDSQARRFGQPAPRELTPALLPLARAVMAERRLLRWEGARTPAPADVGGDVVGWPLTLGDECRGAIVCVQVVVADRDPIERHALRLVVDLVDQVVTLAWLRLSLRDACQELQAELGQSRGRLRRQEETLRDQSMHIGRLSTELVDANQAKSSFLALMSHELRTPLSVILGFGSMLQEGLAGPLSDQQSEYLDRIYKNGRHLHRLIEDMLFFVDAETTQVQPQWTDVDLPKLVQDVVACSSVADLPGGPTLTVDIAPDARRVRSDEKLLHRLLFHLVGNAFKFTQDGEVRVEAARATDGSGVELRVLDTGVGVAPDQLNRIFELFRQGEEATTRRHDGLGLGLALVQTCLMLLGGRCRITPRVEGGTQVSVWLPDRRSSSVAAAV